MTADALDALIDAQAAHDQALADADGTQRRRDAAIKAARDAGVTWAVIQRATRLTPQAVAKAIKRAT